MFFCTIVGDNDNSPAGACTENRPWRVEAWAGLYSSRVLLRPSPVSFLKPETDRIWIVICLAPLMGWYFSNCKILLNFRE